MNNKFIKFLVILNGVLLPIIMFYAIYNITKDMFPAKEKVERGLIIGEELEEAKKDSVALQGLKYYYPNNLYNSTNQYLPISLLTYEEEKNLLKTIRVSNDVGSHFLKYVNVIFLDKNYQTIGSLLDKKASITEIQPQYKSTGYNNEEIDKTVKYIGYLIAFNDSNNDGKLNSSDNHDLYLSDLSGKNLKKVSNDIDVKSFKYIKSNSKIFIEYTARIDMREEHKKKKFAIYDIESSRFLNLSSIDKELDKLEKIIIE
ncbi:MAG: hypothetical protein JXR05_16115 [Flavobacteriaceae bacterium]